MDPDGKGLVQSGVSVECFILTYFAFLTNRREATVESGAPGAGLKSGDVIVANWNSYVDIIYLGFRFAPTFTKIVKTGDSVIIMLYAEANCSFFFKK